MSQTMTIFMMAASISALFLTVVSMVLAGLALGQVYGLRNSTHKIIQGPWNKVEPQEPEFINADEPIDEDEIQDYPKTSKPLTLQEQMKKYMYRDVEDEQV